MTQSIRRQKGEFLAITVSSAVGAAVIASMLGIYLDVGDKMAKELAEMGANIEVAPENTATEIEFGGVSLATGGAYLQESDLLKLKEKTCFWRNNILNIVPFLYAQGKVEEEQVTLAGVWFSKKVTVENENYRFGVENMFSWKIKGRYPSEDEEVVLGGKIARRLSLDVGGEFMILTSTGERKFAVSGVADTGGMRDYLIFTKLKVLQDLTGRENKISKASISALTKPEDELATKADLYGHESLDPEEFEKWICSPYVGSIVYDIEKTLPQAEAREIREFSEVQGGLLESTTLVFGSLSAIAFLVSIMGFDIERMIERTY